MIANFNIPETLTWSEIIININWFDEYVLIFLSNNMVLEMFYLQKGPWSLFQNFYCYASGPTFWSVDSW